MIGYAAIALPLLVAFPVFAAECPAGSITSAAGSGAAATRPFHSGTPWELQWSFDGSPGLFQATIMAKDGSLVGLAANQQGGEPGSAYEPTPGDYYISVNAVFMSSKGRWRVCVVPVPG